MMDSAAYYNEHADRFIADTLGLDMTELYTPFLARVPAGGRILDLGCGTGRDSLAFLSKGYDVLAADPSSAMADHAEYLIGRPVLRMYAQQLDAYQVFDGVWACSSLLHIPRENMDDVLGRVGRSLRRDGVFFVSYKYGDGEVERGGRLFNSYDEETFQAELAAHPNLIIEQLWVTGDVRPERSQERWLNALVRVQGVYR